MDDLNTLARLREMQAKIRSIQSGLTETKPTDEELQKMIDLVDELNLALDKLEATIPDNEAFS